MHVSESGAVTGCCEPLGPIAFREFLAILATVRLYKKCFARDIYIYIYIYIYMCVCVCVCVCVCIAPILKIPHTR